MFEQDKDQVPSGNWLILKSSKKGVKVSIKCLNQLLQLENTTIKKIKKLKFR